MKLPNPYACDFHGSQFLKGESNGWFLVECPANGQFTVCAWKDGDPDAGGVKHACSEQCVGKAMNTWFADRRPVRVVGEPECVALEDRAR
jgi:hypothetical protein